MSTSRTVLPSGRRPYLAVPYYDGRTKDTILDAYNCHRGVHPNDSGMSMSLLVRKGSCKADPNTGNTLHLIRDLSAPDLEAQVRSCVESAFPLSRLVVEGGIRIERIEHQASRGKLAVVVYYTNLDTDERQSIGWYT
jgi:hypothetical protein